MEMPTTPSPEPKLVDTSDCLSETQLAEIPLLREVRETLKVLGFPEAEIERRIQLLIVKLKNVICSTEDIHIKGVIDPWLAEQAQDAPLKSLPKPT